MEQRLSVVTLGVADMARARRFYEDGLGWRRANEENEVTFYPVNGSVLGLFGREALAEDAGLDDVRAGTAVAGPDGAPAAEHGAPRFGGVALAYNTRTREEVDEVLARAASAGALILKPAAEAFWGGYHGYFADPDGHPWEVAYNPYWALDDRGDVLLGAPDGRPEAPSGGDRAAFLHALNAAFARGDVAWIDAHVTDDITWTMVGDNRVEGRAEFLAALAELEIEEPLEMEIQNIVIQGDRAVVDGTMRPPGGPADEPVWAFCDLYAFGGAGPGEAGTGPRIRSITSYMVEIPA